MNKKAVIKPSPKSPIVKKPPVITPKKPASELVDQFLSANDIILNVQPVLTNIKEVSDGSVIISKPGIIATYKTDASRRR